MQLSEEEIEEFHEIYDPLLSFADEELNVVRGEVDPGPSEWEKYLENLSRIRDELFEDPSVIDKFIDENPEGFGAQRLETLRKWREHFLWGEFFIVKYLKNYTVFLGLEDPRKAYGVLGHETNLKDMFRGTTPVAVETVLLPFEGRITYDGLIAHSGMRFGGEISEDINAEYQEAKHRFGIIESLPAEVEREEKSDEEKLKFYMKSKKNRERYREEIRELSSKNDHLESIYYRELGKKNVRKLGRKLRDLGVEEGWFAVLEDTVVASGEDEEEVKERVGEVLPEERRDHVYLYHLSG